MLSVLYASGESIYFHDNSEPMLSLDVVKELVVLYGLEPEPEPAYTVLTPEEAMTIVTSGDYADCLIVDVRQPDEYAEGHIPGAVCVPNEDIQAEQTGALPDPDQMLLLYSGSGSRSKEAAQKLTELGYTYVCEFGGIVDWPGEVVTD
ncbi:MAG: rhodanese-like domain-containing protein [Oscillospiraceae bacterium]|nr:rhodanese-like domain-containing protein [Oscillospiraceae bacterium]